MNIGIESDGARPARRQLVENGRRMIVSRMGYYENDRRPPE
jgi:hypothetical protein